MNYKIAICDDSETDRLYITNLAGRWAANAGHTVQIIFITGFPDYMAEGYEVSALHYLMKPVVEEKLFTVLDRAIINIVKAQKQYVAIHTGDKIYRMKASLSDTEKLLDEYFFKCQRSFLVDLRYVKRILQTHVVLKNDEEVPISRGMAGKIGKEIIRLF